MVGKIPSEQLRDLKLIYGEIFAVDEYIVRKLTVKELTDVSNLERIDAEELIVDWAVLWPENTDDILPGHITSLAEEILEISDLYRPGEILDEARDRSSRIINMMYAFVLATMDSYSEEELSEFTLTQLADKVALAENIMEIQRSVYAGVEVRLSTNTEEEIEDEEEVTFDESAPVRKPPRDPDAPTTYGTSTTNDPVAQKLIAALG